LALDCEALATASPEARGARIAALVSRFVLLPRSNQQATIESVRVVDGVTIVRRTKIAGPDDPTWVAELALRLASDVPHVEAWAGEHLQAGVACLLELPTLARAARFLVLAIDHLLNSKAAVREIYAGWAWA